MSPNYMGSSSSSGATTQPIIPAIPMDADSTIETRGRSRERTPRIQNEDELQTVSVKKRVSTYEKNKSKRKSKIATSSN